MRLSKKSRRKGPIKRVNDIRSRTETNHGPATRLHKVRPET